MYKLLGVWYKNNCKDVYCCNKFCMSIFLIDLVSYINVHLLIFDVVHMEVLLQHVHFITLYAFTLCSVCSCFFHRDT